jgi:ribosomal protein L11 methylase PrmA
VKTFDWSMAEISQPIWITDGCCVCLGDVKAPREPAVCFRLQSPTYFGTGAHPKTRALLLALLEVNLDGLAILDFRAGSGLLGIYCSHFGAEVVSHNDKRDALIKAIQNAIQNNIIMHPSTNTELLNGYSQHFDMVISHQISAKSARKDLPLLEKLTHPFGSVLLSGWEANQHQFVQSIVEEFFNIKLVADLNGHPLVRASR